MEGGRGGREAEEGKRGEGELGCAKLAKWPIEYFFIFVFFGSASAFGTVGVRWVYIPLGVHMGVHIE